jgi:hypothetical protein
MLLLSMKPPQLQLPPQAHLKQTFPLLQFPPLLKFLQHLKLHQLLKFLLLVQFLQRLQNLSLLRLLQLMARQLSPLTHILPLALWLLPTQLAVSLTQLVRSDLHTPLSFTPQYCLLQPLSCERITH